MMANQFVLAIQQITISWVMNCYKKCFTEVKVTKLELKQEPNALQCDIIVVYFYSRKAFCSRLDNEEYESDV